MPDGGEANRRVVCDVCGYSALAEAQGPEHCPNCGAKLRGGQHAVREPRPPGSTAEDIRTWLDTQEGKLERHERILVEIVRRRPPADAGYRDSAEVRERIRIRHRMTDWFPSATRLIGPSYAAAFILFAGWSWLIAAGVALAGTAFAVLPVAQKARKLRRDALELDPEEVVVASTTRLPASRIRAVEHHPWHHAQRVRLVLDDGEHVTVLEDLDEHQAKYVVHLIEDTLGVETRSVD